MTRNGTYGTTELLQDIAAQTQVIEPPPSLCGGLCLDPNINILQLGPSSGFCLDLLSSHTFQISQIFLF